MNYMCDNSFVITDVSEKYKGEEYMRKSSTLLNMYLVVFSM